MKIFGRKPVLEAINAGIRLEVIYIAFGQRGDAINRIFSAAKKHGIKISQVSPHKFEELTKDGNAQGVLAIKGSHKFYELDEIIDESKKQKYPLLLLLDTIQDTHNLGAILRSAECAGVNGVIITTNQSAPINDTVEKISAGALSHLKICRINNLARTIDLLKKEGFWIVGSQLSDKSKNYTEIDYKIPIALIVGNEEKGIRKLTADNCDFLVKIPMKGKIDSLNVSVASGILLFEINRQRE